MIIKPIMSGKIEDISRESLRPTFAEFVDLIEGYDVANMLTDENAKEVNQAYVEQTIEGSIKVQTVIGANYRINLHEDDSIHLILNGSSFSNAQNVIDFLEEKEYTYKTLPKNSSKRISVEIGKDADLEDIIKMFTLFNIQ